MTNLLHRRAPLPDKVELAIVAIAKCLTDSYQPSAWELIKFIRDWVGGESLLHVHVKEAVSYHVNNPELSRMHRAYLESLLHSGDLSEALKGSEPPGRQVASEIDQLMRQAAAYRSSECFAEMLKFVARFKEYSPFNNMLVYLQNPSCVYFATQKNWFKKFQRYLKEDAKPMIILAPMHPILPVYDLDQTQGAPLPEHYKNFAKFEGAWNPKFLDRTTRNAEKNTHIRVDFKMLSSSYAGFATTDVRADRSKRRIVIHADLDGPSRFGVLCHELAHVFLGHLGADKNHWWPSRMNLSHQTKEVEAEAVAYIVTARLGLKGQSASYLARFTDKNAKPPPAVSVDMIAKVAGRIEQMATKSLPERPLNP